MILVLNKIKYPIASGGIDPLLQRYNIRVSPTPLNLLLIQIPPSENPGSAPGVPQDFCRIEMPRMCRNNYNFV